MTADIRPDADEPLDGEDLALLGRLRTIYEHDDAPPEGLVDWVTLAMSLDDADIQMVRLSPELHELASRSGDEGARTITFENSDMTVMLRLEDEGDGTLRVDGWVAPAREHDVEIRTGSQTQATRTDVHGRFALDHVRTGLAHLVLRTPSGTRDGGMTTITQPVVL